MTVPAPSSMVPLKTPLLLDVGKAWAVLVHVKTHLGRAGVVTRRLRVNLVSFSVCLNPMQESCSSASLSRARGRPPWSDSAKACWALGLSSMLTQVKDWSRHSLSHVKRQDAGSKCVKCPRESSSIQNLTILLASCDKAAELCAFYFLGKFRRGV